MKPLQKMVVGVMCLTVDLYHSLHRSKNIWNGNADKDFITPQQIQYIKHWILWLQDRIEDR